MKDRKAKKLKDPVAILVWAAIIIAAVLIVRSEIVGGGKNGEMVTVTVPQGSSTAAIADTLQESELIISNSLFRLYSKLTGGDGNYQYGDFIIERGTGYKEIIEILCSTVSYRETVSVTFPEGYNAFQMGETLEAAGLCTAAEYLEAAGGLDYDFDWMDEISTNPLKMVALDGFLFPDTYSFYTDATARDIVTTQLKNFENKVLTEENRTALAESGFSLEEWVIFSAIIQKESANVEEMYNVASVFTNRMSNQSTYPMLQSCTTNNYIWDYIEPKYNKKVPQEILDAYDTYNKAGLPVGAIANAGVDAFDAALHPNDTPYYFFVTDVEYTHYYGITYQDHQNNIAKATKVNAKYGINGLVTR